MNAAPPAPPQERSAAVRRSLGRLGGPLIAAGIVLFLGLPVLDLDPPRSVTFSDSPFTDEAWYVLNARDLVLFGRWATNDWTLHLVTPVYAGLQAGTFALLGAGILQARLAVVVVTALTAALLASALRREVGPAPALVAAVGFGTSTLVLYYGRLAYAEMLVGLALLAAAVMATRASARDSLRWGLFAGVALALSAGAKPIALGAAVGILAGTIAAGAFLGAPLRRAVLRWGAGACLSFAAAALAWLLLLWLPAGDDASRVLRILAPQPLPESVAELVQRLAAYPLRNDGALLRSAPLVLGGLAGLAAAVLTGRSLPPPVRLLCGAGAGWFLLGLGAILVLDYRPNRYIVPLLPALAILVAFAVRRSLGLVSPAAGRLSPVLACALFATVLALPGLATYADWIGRGTRTLPGVESRVRELLPAGAAVEGPYAPAIALAAPAIALVARPESGINAGDLYATRNVRWVVADGTYEPVWADEHQVAWMAREVVLCFSWGESWQEVCLLRLP